MKGMILIMSARVQYRTELKQYMCGYDKRYNDVSYIYTIKHNFNMPIKRNNLTITTTIKGIIHNCTNSFEIVDDKYNEDKDNYITISITLKELSKITETNPVFIVYITDEQSITEAPLFIEPTLKSHKQWIEERYYEVIHILNESKTMSAELLKECEWLSGELLKEMNK